MFGDLNQQGALAGNCRSSQNVPGGLFFVIDNAALNDNVGALIRGDTAPARRGRSMSRPSDRAANG